MGDRRHTTLLPSPPRSGAGTPRRRVTPAVAAAAGAAAGDLPANVGDVRPTKVDEYARLRRPPPSSASSRSVRRARLPSDYTVSPPPRVGRRDRRRTPVRADVGALRRGRARRGP